MKVGVELPQGNSALSVLQKAIQKIISEKAEQTIRQLEFERFRRSKEDAMLLHVWQIERSEPGKIIYTRKVLLKNAID